MLGTLQPRAFGSLNRVETLDSASNYYNIMLHYRIILVDLNPHGKPHTCSCIMGTMTEVGYGNALQILIIIFTAATDDHETDEKSLNTEIPVSQVRVQYRPGPCSQTS